MMIEKDFGRILSWNTGRRPGDIYLVTRLGCLRQILLCLPRPRVNDIRTEDS